MRVLAWNIQSGGGPRIAKIAAAVASHSADTVVLTEFRNGTKGQQLRARLANVGLSHQQSVPVPDQINTVLIASNSAFRHQAYEELNDHVRSCLLAQFEDVNILGLYFPQQKAKRAVFDFLRSLPSSIRDKDSLLIGDFNTGKHLIDEAGKTFQCADNFCKLETDGWTDLWRRQHGQLQEHTWFSQKKNGFRIDHAFASPSLVPRIKVAGYSHQERIEKTSDHSILLVDID